jgi:HTH-type transcriptional regulator/antitoxin HigA
MPMHTKHAALPIDNPHPGQTIRMELEERGLKQKDFAEEIKISYSQLNEIIQGKRHITPDFALILEAAWGMEALTWLSLQSQYDLGVVKSNYSNLDTKKLKEWNDIREYIPYNYFKKKGLIHGNIDKDIMSVKEVYNVKELMDIKAIVEDQPVLLHRKSEALSADLVNLIGWSKYVAYKIEKEAKEVTKKYDSSKKSALIEELKVCFLGENIIKNVKKVLGKYGIKFTVEKNPEKTPVDGIALWSIGGGSQGRPAIGITQRFERLDNLAFTLFHELGHIFLHEEIVRTGCIVDNFDDSKSKTTKIEREANEFAGENLIPSKEWDAFYDANEFTEESIINFSNTINIHPAITLGRLRFENPIYYRRRFRIPNEIC